MYSTIVKSYTIIIISFLTFSVLGASTTALAESGNSLSIGIVDMQEVISKSIIGKAAKSNLENEVAKREGTLDNSKNEITKLRADLEKQASVLSGSSLDEKRSLLEKKEREFARQVQDQREDLSKKNRAEISRVVQQIQEVIKSLAAKNDYDLVLEKGQQSILFANDRFDITKKVIEELDSKKIKG